MKDESKQACVMAVCGTVGYVTYVTITHADGVVFASFMAFLGAIGGYIYAKGKR